VRELRNIVHRAYVMTEGKIIRAEVVKSLLPSTRRSGATRRPAAVKGGRPARSKASANRKK
jgi:DNA-binding NtrC family response regulator